MSQSFELQQAARQYNAGGDLQTEHSYISFLQSCLQITIFAAGFTANAASGEPLAEAIA